MNEALCARPLKCIGTHGGVYSEDEEHEESEEEIANTSKGDECGTR